MKITWRMLVLAALALALTGGAEAVPASAKPAPGVQLQLTYSSVSGISGMAGGIAQIKNGVSYMPANLVTVMGLEIKWNNADKTATFSGWNKSFSMKLGQSTGVLDGKKVSLGGTPYVADKQLYVPVKFVVAALEGGCTMGCRHEHHPGQRSAYVPRLFRSVRRRSVLVVAGQRRAVSDNEAEH